MKFLLHLLVVVGVGCGLGLIVAGRLQSAAILHRLDAMEARLDRLDAFFAPQPRPLPAASATAGAKKDPLVIRGHVEVQKEARP